MCGIYGNYLLRPVENIKGLKARLQSAQRALHHRGPDERGVPHDGGVGARLLDQRRVGPAFDISGTHEPHCIVRLVDGVG